MALKSWFEDWRQTTSFLNMCMANLIQIPQKSIIKTVKSSDGIPCSHYETFDTFCKKRVKKFHNELASTNDEN